MKKNGYFQSMIEVEAEYNKANQEFDALKHKMREELGSDGYYEWVKEQEKPQYPFTSGQAKALRAIYWCELDELEMDDHVWESEVEDFVDTLRKCEVGTFVVTCKSTALMENMHWYAQNGCKLVGLCEIEKPSHYLGTEKKMGVRFEL